LDVALEVNLINNSGVCSNDGDGVVEVVVEVVLAAAVLAAAAASAAACESAE